MAEILKRRYDITVLKIELRTVGRHKSEVHFTFQYQVQGNLVDGGHWIGPVDFGVPESESFSRSYLDQWKQFDLPEGMINEIKRVLGQRKNRTDPLWIHLVKPYGPLKLVYWERVFRRELAIPILMLPDFIFPSPREDESTLEIALCASAPLNPEFNHVYDAVESAILRMREVPGKSMRIHVFVDRDIGERLRRTQTVDDRELVIYDFDNFESEVTSQSESTSFASDEILRSPWLIWIRNALSENNIDIAHFICHGYLSRGRGTMLFAQSPSARTQSYLSNPVGVAELRAFLTQVGAWSTVFTSLPDNASKLGLRVVADEIAQSRPGPMMLHYLDRDATGKELAMGYQFLYGGRASKAPQSDSLLIYCQPYLVAGSGGASKASGSSGESAPGLFSRNDEQRSSIGRTMQVSPTLDYLFNSGNVTPLLSSTQRYAEQVQLKFQQLTRDELLPTESGKRSMEAALNTVHRLQLAVAARGLSSLAPSAAAELSSLLDAEGGSLFGSAIGSSLDSPSEPATMVKDQTETFTRGKIE